MRKATKLTALILSLAMLLSLTVFAEGETSKLEIVIPQQAEGVTVTATAGDSDKSVTINYCAGSDYAGAQFVILMVKGVGESLQIAKDTILYINQDAADANGEVQFKVYPSSMQDGTIMIAAAGLQNSPVTIATVNVPYVRGDADGNGKVDGADLIMIAQYLVGTSLLTSVEGADADANGKVDGADIIKLARYIVGIESLG